MRTFRHRRGGLLGRMGRRASRGSALIFALTAALILSLLILGVTTLCTQDYSLANTQRDATIALNTAEAAVNWELNKMARVGSGLSTDWDRRANPYEGPLPSDANGLGGPKVSGATPVQGTVRVYVTNPNEVDEWSPPGSDFVLFASGTYNGIMRSLKVYGTSVGLGELYTLYGIRTLELQGRRIVIASPVPTQRNYVGTAGTASVQAGAILNGTVVFNQAANGLYGVWEDGNPAGWDWILSPQLQPFPTVEQLAARAIFLTTGQQVADPLLYLQNNNDNAVWIRARDSEGRLYPIRWQDNAGNPLPQNRITRELFNANDPIPNSGGKRLAAIVLMGNPSLLPNGYRRGSNFYFETIDLPSNQTLEIQNGVETRSAAHAGRYGPVRLWLGPKEMLQIRDRVYKFDLLQGQVLVDNADSGTSADPSAFTIYNGSPTPIRLGGSAFRAQDARGNVGFYGNIVSYSLHSSLAGIGTVEIVGDFTLRGSIVAWSLRHTNGDLNAYLPPSPAGGSDVAEYILHYALNANWLEQNRFSGSGGSQ
jgi:hypothetical protein